MGPSATWSVRLLPAGRSLPSDGFSLKLFNPSKLPKPNLRLGIANHRRKGRGWSGGIRSGEEIPTDGRSQWEAWESRDKVSAHLWLAGMGELAGPGSKPVLPRTPRRFRSVHGRIHGRTPELLGPATPPRPAPRKAGSAAARTPRAGAGICWTSRSGLLLAGSALAGLDSCCFLRAPPGFYVPGALSGSMVPAPPPFHPTPSPVLLTLPPSFITPPFRPLCRGPQNHFVCQSYSGFEAFP